MKKQVLSIILAVAMMFSLAAVTSITASAQEYGDFEYELLDDGTVEITGYTGSTETLEIPSEIDGKSVTTIGDYAFWDCDSLTSVTIPDSVTSIGNCAFWGCDSLVTIAIPASVTGIGREVFYSCDSLSSIDVSENNNCYCSENGVLFNKDKTELIQYPSGNPDTSYSIPNIVSIIYQYAFLQCKSLKSIVIPNSVKTIGYSAFWHCKSLESITIPNSVETIAGFAFYCCDSLKNVMISKSVKNIGDNAFDECGALESINVSSENEKYSSIDGILYSKDFSTLIRYPAGKTNTNFSIPNNVTKIYKSAFSSSTILSSVMIPNSVTEIGKSAFYQCTSLINVELSEGVEYIGESAFSYCRLLSNITIPSSVISVGDQAFYVCESLSNITIPEKLANIGNMTFSWCKSLKSIEVSSQNSKYCSVNGVLFSKDLTTLIQFPAGKTNTSYSVPDNVNTIASYSFLNCTCLTSIVLSNSVKCIDANAFYFCRLLTSITLTDAIISVGNNAFYDCPIKEITISDGSYTILPLLIVSNKVENVVIPNSVSYIGDNTFEKCELLKSITIPNSVTKIGSDAFAKNTKIICNCKSEAESYAIKNNLIYELKHDESIIEGKAATCTEDGLTDGKKCSVCGEILEAQQTIKANGHTEEAIPGKAATCTEDGLTDGKKCSVCGEVLVEQQVIPSKGHTYTFVDEVPATYDNDGIKAHYICSECDKLFDLDKNEVTSDKLVIPRLEKTVIYGDANGDGKINLLDLIAMRKYLAKWNIEIDTVAADCNADGKVNLLDLILLRKYLAKWNVVLGPQA